MAMSENPCDHIGISFSGELDLDIGDIEINPRDFDVGGSISKLSNQYYRESFLGRFFIRYSFPFPLP